MMNPPTIRLLALVLCVLFAPCAWAEEVPPLVTDRPDFTESAETVPRGAFQLEFGYTYGEEGDLSIHTVGELLLRAALGDRIELRVGLNSWIRLDGGPAGCTDGLVDSYLGAKIKLLEAPDEPGGGRPGIALLLGTTLPTGKDEFGVDEPQPDVKLALAWDLTGRTALSTNVGYASLDGEEGRVDELSGSLSLGYGLTDTVGCYLEYYQFFLNDDPLGDPGFVNGGLTWLTADNFQLDWRIGYQVAGEYNAFYTGIGGSWRWLRRNK